MGRRRVRFLGTLAVLGAAVLVIGLGPLPEATSASFAAAQNIRRCESCHGGFRPADLQLVVPPEVQPGERFQAQVLVTDPWRHQATDNVIQVGASGGLAGDPGPIPTVPNLQPGAGVRRAINLTAGEVPGEVWVNLSTTARYNHRSASNPDARPYAVSARAQVVPRAVALLLSERSLALPLGQSSSVVLTLTNADPQGRALEGIAFEAPPGRGVVVEPANLTRLAPGASAQVTVRASPTPGAPVSVTVRWTAGGVPDQTRFTVAGLAAPVDAGWPYLWGRTYGFVAVGTALFASGQGFFRRHLERRLLARQKAGLPVPESPKERYRWWYLLHTSLLYALIGFTLLHVWLLLQEGWQGSWDLGLVLGNVSLVLFGVVGVSGLFPRETTVVAGLSWRRIHLVVTIVAVVLAGVHMVLSGSTFG